ncbi:hypothetical protein FF100_35215 [Methylobacterium terricola]|uniref:Uncharacterized protein n=1 Tax=Methylobacterium terricola TaxID=2583531 RepID=A0A5C4L7L8_9HYPH|nr:hypothetical protein [Methylobacterium terricola]TNC05870.1 hypothetical protein FF100_35215 [Methylobacterium terricola]
MGAPIRCQAFLPAALAAVLLVPSAVRARDLPRPIQAELDAEIQDCKPQTVTLGRKFVEQKDVTGDGVPDYILNYGEFRCGDRGVLYCGSGGCTTKIFAATVRNGYTKVFDQIVRDLQPGTARGRPVLFLGLHGSACGKVGAEPCGQTLAWNGTRFVRPR